MKRDSILPMTLTGPISDLVVKTFALDMVRIYPGKRLINKVCLVAQETLSYNFPRQGIRMILTDAG